MYFCRMKNLIIPFEKYSEVKLIIELAKRLGFKPRVEEITSKRQMAKIPKAIKGRKK